MLISKESKLIYRTTWCFQGHYPDDDHSDLTIKSELRRYEERAATLRALAEENAGTFNVPEGDGWVYLEITDRRLASQFNFDKARLQPEEGEEKFLDEELEFEVEWGENGKATFKFGDGSTQTVQM